MSVTLTATMVRAAFLDQHLGPVYEEAFREYLRREANQGALGEGIVAVGPWWSDASRQEIDAVVLAQRELTRVPVLVGESKWAQSVDAVRIKAGLIRKAAALTPDTDELSAMWSARETPSSTRTPKPGHDRESNVVPGVPR
jgi:uncharacterized protein